MLINDRTISISRSVWIKKSFRIFDKRYS